MEKYDFDIAFHKFPIWLFLYAICSVSVSFAQDYFVTAPYTSPARNTCGAINNCSMRTTEDHEYQVTIPSSGTWIFSLCASSYDTYLYVGTTLCSSNIGLNDDACSLQSEITVTITAGTYYVTVEGFSGCGTYVLDISKQPSAGPGENCANPYLITSLPFIQTGMTTCGFNDVYSSADACASSYMNGDDFVFEYTPSINEVISVTLSNTGSYTGVFVTQGCPDIGSCVDYATSSSGNPSLGCVPLTGGVTYYITISTWPSPQCTAFDIDMHTVPGVTTGTTCANPTVISALPYTQTGMTTCCYGDDYSSANACASSYMNGDDYVFEYTPATNEIIDITLSNTGTYTGVFVTQGCPDVGTCVDYDTQSSGNPSLSCVTLTGGTTYYIIVSTLPSPQCTPFDIDISQSSSTAPDCSLNYAWSTIAYSPYSYLTGTTLSFPDDHFALSYTPLGFNFCFDGVFYNQVLISSNAYLLFPSCFANVPGGSPTPNGYSPWDIDAAIPNTTDAPTNAVLGPWHDINPGMGGTIRYQTYGTTPNQVFVLKYYDVPMFDCETNSTLNFNGQIMLYETTNNIEVHLGTKRVCSTWPMDVPETAILGLHNYNGTIAVVPTGTNYPNSWTATNQAVRFTPSCTSCNNILPIELLSFYGENEQNAIILNWETASEKNTDYFLVQKSDNKSTFEDILKIPAKGNSNDVTAYQAIDNNPVTGVNYFRLKEVDRDGGSSFSDVIQVQHFGNTSLIVNEVYPNPAHDHISLDVIVKEPIILKTTLSDISGREAYSNVQNTTEGYNHLRLDISGIAKGWYTLKIYNGTEFLSAKSILIR